MIVFPNGKINLGLNVTGKRADGYHDLETVFYPVACRDVLEVIPAPQFSFSTSGLPIGGPHGQNLCTKAWDLLQQETQSVPAVHMHLHKAIPMGAGLGGGSADGAFALKLLNEKCRLGLNQSRLLELALQLGSDCPFFINNRPCFATGRGEIMEPIDLDLSSYSIVLVNPGIHVSTAQAFAGLSPKKPTQSIKSIIAQPVSSWRCVLVNDFEENVFNLHPEIAGIKAILYEQGAVYAAMSGTGSTVFGLFKTGVYDYKGFPAHYWISKG